MNETHGPVPRWELIEEDFEEVMPNGKTMRGTTLHRVRIEDEPAPAPAPETTTDA